MATLNELYYSLRESYKLYSDDGNISNEYLIYKIHIGRNLLLSQKFSSRSFVIPNKIRQHFYLETELVEGNEFVSGLSTILRTKDPIQTPLEPFNFKSNMRVSTGSYTDLNFTLISPDRLPFVGKNKWLQNHVYYTIGSDFRLYFVSTNPRVKAIENIKLSMVCENPEKAWVSSVDYDPAIEFEYTEYPMEGDMIIPLTDMILKSLTINLQSPEDKTNDSESNS